jgi:thioredoxin 1
MPQQPVIDIDDRNLAATIASDLPVLIDFTAVWCPPCRAIAPHVEAVARKYEGRVVVGKLDADSNPETTARYDVRSLPTLLVFRRGQVVGQIVGAVPRPRIEALLDRALEG